MSNDITDPKEYHVCCIRHESPQSEILTQIPSTSERATRRVFLVVTATNKLLFLAADKAKHQPQAISEILNATPESSSSYTAQSSHDATGADSPNPPIAGWLEIHLNIPNNYKTNTATPSHASIQNENTSNTDIPRPLQFRTRSNELSRIVKEKDLVSLEQLGGVEGIAARLNTKVDHGISNDDDELKQRQFEYGSNEYTDILRPPKPFLQSVYMHFRNWAFFLLLCTAALSLASGIIREGPRQGWYGGTAIFIFIFVDIAVSDVRVGDIASLKTNDTVPADGIFFKGNDFDVDDNKDDSIIDCVDNPFLFSGAKVIKGNAHMLITSVGKSTAWHGMMRTVSHDPNKKTLLQARLDNLATKIIICGLIQEIFILLTLILRFSLGELDDETGYPGLKGKESPIGELMMSMEKFITNPRGFSIFSLKLLILLSGIQEGLPFLITLALPYWKERMYRNQGLVQKSWAAVTMGSVTAICTDETASLTLKKLEVDMLWIGDEIMCEDRVSRLSKEILEAIRDAAGIPVIASDRDQIDNSIIAWADLKLGLDVDNLKQSLTVLYAKTSSLGNKRSGFVVRKNEDAQEKIHIHWSGNAETVLAMCCNYYDSDGTVRAMNEQKRAQFEQVIEDVSTKGLQSVALAYKVTEQDENDNDYATKLEEDGLVLLGLMSLKNLCCPEAIKAVTAFQRAGVSIKLIRPERLSILRNIAILRPEQDLSEVAIQGEDFRNLTEEVRMEMVEKISVIASALPSDKLLFVQCLKKKGHVVAVTGSMTCDSPSLMEADLGLLTGIRHSETARENADIVIRNCSLGSMFTLMLDGRSAYRNIQNFIQFVLTMNISGPVIATVATIYMGESPLTEIQLFWVSLMVGTLAAFALLTEAPSTELMELPAVSQTGQLIKKCMWGSIATQVFYQAMVLLIIQFKGQALPWLALKNSSAKNAFIFNSFVLCQVFNQWTARATQTKYTIKGIRGNYWFLVAVTIPTLFQVIMTELVPSYADTARLNWVQWLGSILIAILSLLLGCIVKYFDMGRTSCGS